MSPSRAAYLPAQLGVCPSCSVVVPLLFAIDHDRWHKDRDEPAGPLRALRDVLP